MSEIEGHFLHSTIFRNYLGILTNGIKPDELSPEDPGSGQNKPKPQPGYVYLWGFDQLNQAARAAVGISKSADRRRFPTAEDIRPVIVEVNPAELIIEKDLDSQGYRHRGIIIRPSLVASWQLDKNQVFNRYDFVR